MTGLVLAVLVLTALFTWLLTRPRPEPVPTREVPWFPFGLPVIASPHVPPGTILIGHLPSVLHGDGPGGWHVVVNTDEVVKMTVRRPV